MKTGLIDVGGGLRGVYGAGVMDRFMEEGITFDLCIGVSSGCANVLSFLAGQRKRNHRFYTIYPLRDEYMSLQNRRTKGCYLDVQYIYGTLSNSDGEDPFDYKTFCENPSDFIGVGTYAASGEVKYFGKQDMSADYYNVLMASCALPYICTPQEVNGHMYYDGSVSDPLPIKKALEEGCDRIVLILNMPIDQFYSGKEDARLAEKIASAYPKTAETLCSRAEKYREGIVLAKKLAATGIVKIISPDSLCGVDTLSKDTAALETLYQKGVSDAAAAILSFRF